MPVEEAGSQDSQFGRFITSDGWFVLYLADALAVRNDEKGGAMYPLEPRESPFHDFGVNVRILWPGDPNALYHSEGVQEGFLVLSGACTLIVEEEERPMRQWDYFHCPANTRHVIVGAGDGPCAILMIGKRPDVDIRCPVSEAAGKYGAAVAREPPNRTRHTPTGRANTSRPASRGRASPSKAPDASAQRPRSQAACAAVAHRPARRDCTAHLPCDRVVASLSECRQRLAAGGHAKGADPAVVVERRVG